MKNEKTMWVFFFYKYGKFWSILPDKKVDLKPLFSDECISNQWAIGQLLSTGFFKLRKFQLQLVKNLNMSAFLDRKPSLEGIFSALWYIIAEIPTKIFRWFWIFYILKNSQSVRYIELFLLFKEKCIFLVTQIVIWKMVSH